MHSVILSSLLLAAPVAAQGNPTPFEEGASATVSPATVQRLLESERFEALRSKVLFDTEADGTVWACGRAWKASFGPDGFTYIPFLGSDAPQNYPVCLQLHSVTIGDTPMAFGEGEVATREGRTVTRDRGSLREVYHVRDDGVEQTFVFDSLPGTGEIVVRLEVESEFAARAQDGGFVFENHLGGVTYGMATAITGSGLEAQLDQRMHDGMIEIRVPSGLTAAESMPLVIDPILTNLVVTADNRDQVDVDVAFDANTGVYMIVYEEVQSAADHDIRSVFYNTNVQNFVSEAVIDVTSWNWVEPRIASSYPYSKFLTVATRGTGIGNRDVWGRMRDAASGALDAPFAITDLIGDNVHPDVGGFGGDFATSFPFLVVWEHRPLFGGGSNIYTQSVREDSGLQGSFVSVTTAPEKDLNPSISKTSGAPSLGPGAHEFLIAWEREIAADNHDIWTRVVGYGGSTLGHDEWRSYSFSDARNVDVSSQDQMLVGGSTQAVYMLAFERLRSGVDEIFTIVAREGETYPARSVPEMQDLGQGLDHHDPRSGQDGTGDYFIAYRVEGDGGYNGHVTAVNIVRDLDDLRTGIASRRDDLVHAPGVAGALAVATTWDGGKESFDSTGMILHTLTGLGGDEEVRATIYAETSSSVEGSQFCDAAENVSGRSAFIRASGSGYNPNGSLTLQVADLPENAFGYAIASLNTAFTPNPGGSAGNLCLSGAIGRFRGQIQNSGPDGTASVVLDLTSIPQPNGTVSVVLGERWKFQYWTRDVAGGMATSNFSNGVVVHFED